MVTGKDKLRITSLIDGANVTRTEPLPHPTSITSKKSIPLQMTSNTPNQPPKVNNESTYNQGFVYECRSIDIFKIDRVEEKNRG